MNYIIRKREKKDCISIGNIIAISWNETYKGIVPDEELKRLMNCKKELGQKQINDFAENNNNYLVLEEVAKKEGFAELSEEEVEFELAKLADQYKMSVENVKKALENQMREFRNNIVMSRVENFLFSNND